MLFGLLALDALLQIPHAPRYGTGFNVAQLPLLDNLGPGRVAYLAGELALAYLFVMAACNVATRIVLPCAAAIYAWLYFGSQVDSYQHHYLIALVLGIACFIPWEPGDGKPVRAWAMRLLLVQLAIMYLWAAISKLDGQWLGGDALASQLGSATLPADRVSVVAKIVEHTIGWAATAWLVVLTEFALACTVWIRRAAVVAAPLGLALHAGIVLTGLEIGLFAWLMIGLYAFVVPDRVWLAIAGAVAGSRAARGVRRRGNPSRRPQLRAGLARRDRPAGIGARARVSHRARAADRSAPCSRSVPLAIGGGFAARGRRAVAWIVGLARSSRRSRCGSSSIARRR